MFFVDILIVMAAYLLGSVPTAYLLAKMRLHRDIREMGSGNVGSTNAARVMGWGAGTIVFVVDVAKGFLPVYAAQLIGGIWLAVAVGLAAFLGHIYPMWLGFRGGKGVAVALGVGLALNYVFGLVGFSLWFVITLLTGYVSLGSVLAVASYGLMCLFCAAPWPHTLLFAIITTLVAVRHRVNFMNILAGRESKVMRRKRK